MRKDDNFLSNKKQMIVHFITSIIQKGIINFLVLSDKIDSYKFISNKLKSMIQYVWIIQTLKQITWTRLVTAIVKLYLMIIWNSST